MSEVVITEQTPAPQTATTNALPPIEYDEKPIPRWQIALAIIFGLAILAFIIFDWSRFKADFWPFDHSNVGPNLVASVVQYAVILIAIALLWPPARRRIRHFASYHVEHLKDNLTVHHDALTAHFDKKHAEHAEAMAEHTAALQEHNALVADLHTKVDESMRMSAHIIEHSTDIPDLPPKPE